MEGNTIGTILTILILVGKWKTFEKLGEKGWKGIIPVYSDYVIFRMAGMSGLNILWSVASVIIAAITVAMGIGAGINESTALMGWTIVMLLVAVIAALVGTVQTIRSYGHICRKLGHSELFALLFLFVPFVMWMVSAFSNDWRVRTKKKRHHPQKPRRNEDDLDDGFVLSSQGYEDE